MAEMQKQTQSASERFTNMVLANVQKVGNYEFTDREKQLVRGYFVTIDQTLAKAEADRVRRNSQNSDAKYNNDLPYTWQNVDLPSLAQDLAHYARVGLDMMEDNALFPIPYKNNKGSQYTMTLMEGYNGIRYQAEKYALDPFKAVTVEVIYSTDKFRPIKRDSRNPVEGYEFEITQPFDRGEIVGVFGYIEYADPAKNKLVIFSTRDVMKRKPRYASPEFWGGKKTEWVYENGKRTKKEVEVEGWVAEMYEKTMKREIYGSKHIPRDPSKIDESYQYIKQREQQYVDIAVESEFVEKNASAETLIIPEPPQSEPVPETPVEPVMTKVSEPVSATQVGMYEAMEEPGF